MQASSFQSRKAFSLVEILVAVAVLAIITVILAGLANQAHRLNSRNQGGKELREAARTALDFIGREMQAAVVPLDNGTDSLQFIVNPPDLASADAVFWQAPIATSASRGDLAEVGYFVSVNGNAFNLCRFFVNPDDANGHYLIYASPANWLSGTLLSSVAPADRASGYRGLFLENVLRLWVTAYDAAGTAVPGYDSRVGSGGTRGLPARVDLVLVTVDRNTAALIGKVATAAQVQGWGNLAAGPREFVASLPPALAAGAGVTSISINLSGRKPGP